jgi:hypothetical protein
VHHEERQVPQAAVSNAHCNVSSAQPASSSAAGQSPAAVPHQQLRARFVDRLAKPRVISKGLLSTGQMYIFFQVSMDLDADSDSLPDYHYVGISTVDVLPRATSRNSGSNYKDSPTSPVSSAQIRELLAKLIIFSYY